jgi:hypothetical protein
VASETPGTVARLAPVVSVLADRDEWIYRDYEKVTRNLDAAHRHSSALETRLGALQSDLAATVREREVLQAAVAGHAGADAELAMLRDEVARRASIRWWLALPLRRLWRQWRALTGRPPAA